MPTEDQIEMLKSEIEKASADEPWSQDTKSWYARRSPETIGALLNLLNNYLIGKIALKQFQVTFDKETRTTWDIMGLKGMSGAMFLNTLVKHIPDQAAVDAALKAALPKPTDPEEGRAKMEALVSFVDSWLVTGTVLKTHVQAARIPYFLSAWWQLQDRESWPVYYSSMRAVYERQGLWKPGNGSVTTDYFVFRDTTFELMRSLSVNVWGVERLCLWLDRPMTLSPGPSKKVPPVLPEPDAVSPVPVGEGTTHSQVQWLLAKLGKQLNLKVWIAQNDHQRSWQGEKLGDYSIPTLPQLGVGEAAQKVVRLIDVIWIKGFNHVVAAFEVESTTSIYSGLLRMSDLIVLAPNTNFPIYIISPQAKLERVREQLRRPTFQNLELHHRCRFFSIEQFIAKAPIMLEWMNDPAAIDKIAERVDDVTEEGFTVTLGDGETSDV